MNDTDGALSSDPIYEDGTVRLDTDALTLRRYYFPTGRSKTIPLVEILSAEVRPANWATRWRLWGSSNLKNWLPLDMRRPRKSEAVVLNVGGRIRPTFTPDDPSRIVDLLT